MSFEQYKLFLQGAKNRKISDNFTVFDVCNSQTALAKGIDNTPNLDILKNATLLINKVLQPLRNNYKAAVNVHCIYRCLKLNMAVGGVATSQHCTGQAADIDVSGHTIEEVFNYIKKNMVFDQLIQEGTWIHVSYSANKNRKQSLRMLNGKYIPA